MVVLYPGSYLPIDVTPLLNFLLAHLEVEPQNIGDPASCQSNGHLAFLHLLYSISPSSGTCYSFLVFLQ